jgi:porphobilinogen synthase
MGISHAAGADILAPSDMMDGRVIAMREGLEENGFTDVGIYLMRQNMRVHLRTFQKYWIVPVDAQEIPADKKTYQMDFHNSREAIDEALRDVEEGADIIMIKPGMPYLDIVSKSVSLLRNQLQFTR